MLTGGISRMQWEHKGKEFILPGRNREASSRECYWTGLEDDEEGKDISVQWNSRRKKQGCKIMWSVGKAQGVWRNGVHLRGRLRLPNMAAPMGLHPSLLALLTIWHWYSSIKRWEFPLLEFGWTFGSPLTNRIWQKYGMWIPMLNHKRHCSFYPASWVICSRGSPAPCHEDAHTAPQIEIEAPMQQPVPAHQPCE